MSLPPLAPIPPASIRLSLASEEWEACLDAWLSLTELYLRLPLPEYAKTVKDGSSLPMFLTSYYQELASLNHSDAMMRSAKAHTLQRTCFILSHRTLLELKLPPMSMLHSDFLADLSHVYMKSQALSQLLSSLWKRRGPQIEASLHKTKDVLTKALDSSALENAEPTLRRLAPLLYASPNAGAFFMTGSDLLDALSTLYCRVGARLKTLIVTFAYLGLLALTKEDAANASMLSDHLYSLKSQSEAMNAPSSLLLALVNKTPLLAKLKSVDRLRKLTDSLSDLRNPSAGPRKPMKRKLDKGKSSQTQTQVNSELHMYRMSLVTQVQDLFPDLGSGFILKLLDEYDDNIEKVTAHLLDESLPTHLSVVDRSEQAPNFNTTTEQEDVDHVAPRSIQPLPTPSLPQRRNVFDNDELDRLEVDTSRLHLGKKDRTTTTADQSAPSKAAILSALAAFDSDDDERDDTYDVEDVGGTVDTAHPHGEPGPQMRAKLDENDEALFSAYKSSPELFGRTFNVRRGQARAALKAETGMADEAIEGWAIMLQRDPARLKRLEAREGAFDGRQTELQSTAYRESPAGTETEDSDVPGDPRDRGGFQGRGRGRGRGGIGRGGSVAGPSGDASTVAAQRRKEANKGSRANHNRRDQRARKMARGGFPG